MISFLKKIFDFYVNGSIHVALSVFALVQMTFFFFHIDFNASMSFFAFFGTIVGYNFVKYDELVRTKKLQMNAKRRAIVIFSGISFLATAYCFLLLERQTQIVSVAFLALTVLYTLPVFPKMSNARNWAGIKIYIVAFCWVGVTVLLPLINAEIPFSTDVLLLSFQRFILVFVLVLIFEIIDFEIDNPHLQTVPQQIGIEKTKLLGNTLLIVFLLLEFLYKENQNYIPLLFKSLVSSLIALFLYFATEKRSRYYASFWVEAIPILWWLLVLLLC